MSKNGSEKDDKVGYGNPPKHAQFKPGQSGNPRGRPKGGRNLKTEMKEVLNAPVAITVDGKRRKVSTKAAGLWTLRHKALVEKHLPSLKLLLDYAIAVDDEVAMKESMAAAAELGASDTELIKSYLERQLRDRSHSAKTDQDDTPDQDEEDDNDWLK